MIMFPHSLVQGFRHTNKTLRWGQAFHQYAKLEKVENTQDRGWCNRLYYAKDAEAKVMVYSRIDEAN